MLGENPTSSATAWSMVGAGGACAVNYTLDTRNRYDYMTGIFHWSGDGISGRPANSDRYQMAINGNWGGPLKDWRQLTFNHTAVETYGWALDDYVKRRGGELK